MLGKPQQIKTKIISSTFFNHNPKSLEATTRFKKKNEKTNTRRLNNILPHNQWITEEIKKEIKKYIQTEMKT